MSAEFTVEVRINEYVYRGDRDDKMLLEAFTVRSESLAEAMRSVIERLVTLNTGDAP